MKEPGICIFCGGGDMTKEHIWPQWLGKHYKPYLAKTNEQSKILNQVLGGKVETDSTTRVREGHIMTRVVRVVCKQCNGGWLSQLEKKSKPTILKFLAGGDLLASTQDSRTLATWLTRFCLCAEFLHHEIIVSTKLDRTAFRLLQQPPPGWKIWVAPYASASSPANFKRTALLIRPRVSGRITADAPATPQANSQVFSISAGFMTALVVSSKLDPSPFEDLSNERMLQVWPPRSGEGISALNEKDIAMIHDAVIDKFHPTLKAPFSS